MSIAINSLPAAPSMDGSAAAPAGTNNGSSILPFEAILEEQAGANVETGDVGGADVPVDVPESAVLAAAVDPTGGVRTISARGIQSRASNDETTRDSAIPGAIKKDKTFNAATALLLLAAQDVLKQFDSAQTLVVNDFKDKSVTTTPVHPAIDDELAQHLFAALTDIEARAVLSADAEEALSTAAVSTPLTDFLIEASEQNAPPDQTRLPDLSFSRPATAATTVPAVGALIDAVRLATGRETLPDSDKGFNQSSSTTGFDRRTSKASVAPAIHLMEVAGNVDAAIKPSPTVPALAIPNEEAAVSSIVQSMRLQMRDGIGTAVVHLEPDYLGAVSIALRVENGVVTAALHADSPQVRAWMEANAPVLRESLASQGLTLDRLVVTDERIADDDPAERRRQQEQQQHARQRPRRDDVTTFEVVV